MWKIRFLRKGISVSLHGQVEFTGPHCGAGGKRNKLLVVNVLKGGGGEMSDHHFVIAKIRCLKSWTGRVVNMEERYEIKISELRKVTYKTEYEDKLNQRWERVKGEVVRVRWKRNEEGLRKKSWRWEKKCVGQGKSGKGRREKGVNGRDTKLGK